MLDPEVLTAGGNGPECSGARNDGPGRPRWILTPWPWKMSYEGRFFRGKASSDSWEYLGISNIARAMQIGICQFHKVGMVFHDVSCLSGKIRYTYIILSGFLVGKGSRPLKKLISFTPSDTPSHRAATPRHAKPTDPGSACRRQRHCAACSAAFDWKTPRWSSGDGPLGGRPSTGMPAGRMVLWFAVHPLGSFHIEERLKDNLDIFR